MISPRILFLQGTLTSGRLFRLSICLLFWKSTDVIENVFKFNFQALASKFHHTACHGCCLQRKVGSRGEGGEIFGIIQDLDLDSKCGKFILLFEGAKAVEGAGVGRVTRALPVHRGSQVQVGQMQVSMRFIMLC